MILSYSDISTQKRVIRKSRFDAVGLVFRTLQWYQLKILEPLEFDASTATKEEITANADLIETAKRIYTLIDTYDKSDTDLGSITIQDFFNELYLTEEQYITALRYYINRATIFLKRNLNEMRINAHNITILHLWKANMDLLFILDSYACAVYVISYIGKSQRGMSKLLRDALLHLKAGNATIKERLRGIASSFRAVAKYQLRRFLTTSSVSPSPSGLELMSTLTPILLTNGLGYSSPNQF